MDIPEAFIHRAQPVEIVRLALLLEAAARPALVRVLALVAQQVVGMPISLEDKALQVYNRRFPLVILLLALVALAVAVYLAVAELEIILVAAVREPIAAVGEEVVRSTTNIPEPLVTVAEQEDIVRK